MTVNQIIRRGVELLGIDPYKLLDRFYVPLDKGHIRRTRNLRLIPTEANRRGGKYSYSEWAHVVGIFQTLMFQSLGRKDGNSICDVGCGTGLLGIASEPFVGNNGRYLGVDVVKENIDFCRRHFPSAGFEFVHLDISNPAYAPAQKSERVGWPLKPASFDMVTALSTWTHLNEEDALFYFKEVSRVLRPGGKAIVTFFLLDEIYQESLSVRSRAPGRYHMTSQERWVFDQPAYGSSDWFHPVWATVPEDAVGVTMRGFNRLISDAGIEMVQHLQGNWKEVPGVFFQDVVVLKKS